MASLLPGTIEEVLRFRPVLHRVSRVAKEDIEVGGKRVNAGHFLFVWVASANRDEEQWKNPDVFALRCSPNPQVAFGSGIHTCLGAPLARLCEGRRVPGELAHYMERKPEASSGVCCAYGASGAFRGERGWHWVQGM